MKPGPYEYWADQGNDILAAECKDGDGEPIAALPGIYSLPDEFRAIAALLNAAPMLIKLALIGKLKTRDVFLADIAQGLDLPWPKLVEEEDLADKLAAAVMELRTQLKAHGLGDHTGREALALWNEARSEYKSERNWR